MSDRYTVQPGDNLSKIARRYDYPSWRVIYYHADNAEFRRWRPNPNLIQPGDVLVLPDRPRSTPPPRATLTLPWNFANRLQLPGVLQLEPLSLTDLRLQGPLLFPVSPPPLNLSPRSAPSTGSSGVTLGGLVQDIPTTPTGEPIRGGYGEALKWAGRATLRYPFVQRRLDAAKDWAIDIAWRSAPPWRKGLEIGVGLVGASVLLSISPTREFIREQVHDQDIPLDPLGVDWISVQPRLGIDGDWGGVINFNLQNLIHPPQSR
ncbi:MAG: LysM peptidoglycan-binding domain-containing protein [Gammaproteobacteria bacterium]|nr:LysM peptidoglycan-binding domain-containing protein [Gammaproteobacteria bacterium]MCP5197828.1 LysM peptidoglycan-binding domain-containing protein [Gammaproteobacteria bacterium]